MFYFYCIILLLINNFLFLLYFNSIGFYLILSLTSLFCSIFFYLCSFASLYLCGLFWPPYKNIKIIIHKISSNMINITFNDN